MSRRVPTVVIAVLIVGGLALTAAPAAAAPQSSDFAYSGAPVPIPDGFDFSGTAPGAVATAPIVVSGMTGRVTDVVLTFGGTACTSDAGATTVGLTHSFINDLRISLVAPDGTAVLVISRMDGGGNNLCQTVLDDSGSISIQSAVTAQAPFSGTWAPANPLAGFVGVDPNGSWSLQVQDFFAQDVGFIRDFSLRLTTDTPNTAVPALGVTGDFVPGGTVTYTATLANTGLVATPDVAGDEFVLVLPAGVTGVSATATSGATAYAAASRTLSWNGTIPANGTVTITLTATVDLGASGPLSAQGELAVDEDLDGVAERRLLTDDPSTTAAGDATVFTVSAPSASPELAATGVEDRTGPLAVGAALVLAGAAGVVIARERRHYRAR